MFGGGIGNAGKLHVFQSTITRNTLPLDALGGQTASGGGICNLAGGTVEIDRSHISENEFRARRRDRQWRRHVADPQQHHQRQQGDRQWRRHPQCRHGPDRVQHDRLQRGQPQSTGHGSEGRYGGGIYNYGGLTFKGAISTVSLGNTIVAKNVDHQIAANGGQDCYAKAPGKVTSFRGNLIGVLTANCNRVDALVPGLLFDQVGSYNAALDPLLAALAANGGPTRTHALQPGSPAIDKAIGLLGGTLYDCTDSDQRLFARSRDGDNDGSKRCDVGAFEAESVAAN